MIKIEHTEVDGWEAAIHDMRNSMSSWDKSDSGVKEIYGIGYEFVIGPDDMALMRKLAAAGSDHSEFLRFIIVTCDITAPLYLFNEFYTYKVGTVANSFSTMHKIYAKEFTLDDFSHEQTVWISVMAAWRGDMKAKIAQLSVAVALNGGEPVKITKEEKKMLNVEKYLTAIKEEIAKDACASKSCLIAKVRGDERPDCNDRTCRDCSDESHEWLFSEYEPPLLKNGDGLKPGDWIMVRDCDKDDWEKKVFVGYLKGYFFCTYELFGALEADASSYSQARLPEEGE